MQFVSTIVTCPCNIKWNFTYGQLNCILFYNLSFECDCGRVLQVTPHGQLNFVELPSEKLSNNGV